MWQSCVSNLQHVFVWFQYQHYDENCNFHIYSNCFYILIRVQWIHCIALDSDNCQDSIASRIFKIRPLIAEILNIVWWGILFSATLSATTRCRAYNKWMEPEEFEHNRVYDVSHWSNDGSACWNRTINAVVLTNDGPAWSLATRGSPRTSHAWKISRRRWNNLWQTSYLSDRSAGGTVEGGSIGPRISCASDSNQRDTRDVGREGDKSSSTRSEIMQMTSERAR